MKKIIALTLLLALSFSVFAFVPVRAEDNDEAQAAVTAINTTAFVSNANTGSSTMEKIPSPDQIKNFRMIKKVEGSLYGVRLQKPEKSEKPEIKKEEMKKENNTVSSSTKAELEKILTPQFINLYEKIQKIGNSLWGVRKDKKGEVKKEEVKPVIKYRIVTADMLVCVSAAIDKKDTAVKARVTLTGEEINTAIGVRGECQKTALQTIENQQVNVRKCTENFQMKHKEIAEKAKTEQQIIWKAYQTELKACAPVTTATSTGEVMIEDGGNTALEAVLAQ